MGISLQPLRLLLQARLAGVDFSTMATLGRHQLNLTTEQLAKTFTESGTSLEESVINSILASSNGFSEPLFKQLGALEITSFDASPYEGASVVHDFNKLLPAQYHNRYSLVIDSGSLEHVFDFPNAIGNLMQAVQVGGHLLICTPANNYCGHGFYQFSPELFYRILSEQSGFTVEGLYLTYGTRATWHQVADPAVLGGRIFCNSRDATLMCILARRTEAVDPFKIPPPQQSDYASTWSRGPAPQDREIKPPGAVRRLVKLIIPHRLLALRRTLRKWLWRRAFKARALKSVPWTEAFS